MLIGFALYLFQDMILFHPKPLNQDYKYSFPYKFTEHNITSGKRNLNYIKFLPDSTAKGIVLYYHGNRRNIQRYADYSKLFTSKGYEVWMMDYPGFGKSTGKRTQQNIYDDAKLLYNLATKQVNSSQIIIYGKSIGTGVASFTASTNDAKHLILETPYYSIDALAKHYFPIYPVSPMTKYSFPINQYLRSANMPVTIFHGTDDEVIPYKQALRLKKEFPLINLITIEEGQHNNLPTSNLYKYTLDRLLD